MVTLRTLDLRVFVVVFFTAVDMKLLKVEEYIKRTASVKETELLLHELEVSIIM